MQVTKDQTVHCNVPKVLMEWVVKVTFKIPFEAKIL